MHLCIRPQFFFLSHSPPLDNTISLFLFLQSLNYTIILYNYYYGTVCSISFLNKKYNVLKIMSVDTLFSNVLFSCNQIKIMHDLHAHARGQLHEVKSLNVIDEKVIYSQIIIPLSFKCNNMHKSLELFSLIERNFYMQSLYQEFRTTRRITLIRNHRFTIALRLNYSFSMAVNVTVAQILTKIHQLNNTSDSLHS